MQIQVYQGLRDGGNRQLGLNGYRDFVWSYEKILEIDVMMVAQNCEYN